MWGLIFLLAYGVPWDSPNAPGWVQAGGSILAVLAAIRIASSQHRADVKRREIDEAQQNVGMATRLQSFAEEYRRLVCTSVHVETYPSQASDRDLARMFQIMVDRLNTVLDHDLNVRRQQQISALRADLATLIFVLNAPNETEGSRALRAQTVRAHQRRAVAMAAACSSLVVAFSREFEVPLADAS